MTDFINIINNIDIHDNDAIEYCCRVIVFLNDLLGQLPTRRFVRCYLEERHIYVSCILSKICTSISNTVHMDIDDNSKSLISNLNSPAHLFTKLLEIFHQYLHFEIDETNGTALPETEVIALHYRQMQRLQRVAFKNFFNEIPQMAMGSIASLDTRDALSLYLEGMPMENLLKFCEFLKVSIRPEHRENRVFVQECLIELHSRRSFHKKLINEMSLYPDEKMLFDRNIVPDDTANLDKVLALPKLNMQFLTMYDYLLRNFNLFRLESAYQVREDIIRVMQKIHPQMNVSGRTVFTGWSRMAIPISQWSITVVKKPLLGEKSPEKVVAEVTVNLNAFNGMIREEWEAIRRHDVLFLLGIDATQTMQTVPDHWVGDPSEFPGAKQEDLPKIDSTCTADQIGLFLFRGAEVVDVLDENKRVIGARDDTGQPHEARGNTRTYRVVLDAAQYQLDSEHAVAEGLTADDIYSKLNLLMRRQQKENNFKSVLETIRNLINTDFSVPPWLHDVLLGYGNPSSAHYSNISSSLSSIEFEDTFLDKEHLIASFPNSKLIFNGNCDFPPYKLTWDQNSFKNKEGTATALPAVLQVETYIRKVHSNKETFSLNKVRFTPTQIEAIFSGTAGGLSVVVGPPGTGKTDVAVQTIFNLYHNCPNQRTLLVAHSNQALNDLFQKIVERDIDERYLLRLGHGESLISGDASRDFSKFGRVNYMLSRRLGGLTRVYQLAKAMGLDDSASSNAASTCETAGHFRTYFVRAMLEKFQLKCDEIMTTKVNTYPMAVLFPFSRFFPDIKFAGLDFETDIKHALSHMNYIDNLFDEVEECRAFELLRSFSDRSNFLVLRHSKIIAMTCTHAALKRRDFIELGFQYDNIIMEEAAQILEIETFIPMLLQNMDMESGHRLKRVVLIGDHNQLPPVVKNRAFQKFSHLDQSMFARLVRLGVTTLPLTLQGRSRSTIADLYRWRYKKLTDLPNITTAPDYLVGNAGFAHEFQFINVDDYQGKGEYCPTPYYYQNLGEAEYVVHVYMFMRLLGYPANKISILSTYNGQKHLIRDVMERRCGSNPMFGRPARITTVDKYQGQQNDYILLSMVRTRAVGHVRDIRRLVVAMSRARYGLYVFGRVDLFKNCYELIQAFTMFSRKPYTLRVIPGETYPCQRTQAEIVEGVEIRDLAHIGKVILKMTELANEHQQSIYEKNLLSYQAALAEFEKAQKKAAEPKSVSKPVNPSLFLASHAATTYIEEGNNEDSENDEDATDEVNKVDLSNIVSAVISKAAASNKVDVEMSEVDGLKSILKTNSFTLQHSQPLTQSPPQSESESIPQELDQSRQSSETATTTKRKVEKEVIEEKTAAKRKGRKPKGSAE